jgi:hypothetical protein
MPIYAAFEHFSPGHLQRLGDHIPIRNACDLSANFSYVFFRLLCALSAGGVIRNIF